MLPGFIPRLQAELVRKLASTPSSVQPPLSHERFGGRSTPTQTSSGASTPSDPATTPTAMRSFRHQQTTSSTSRQRIPSSRPRYDPYTPLRSLVPDIAILNNPSPSPSSSSSHMDTGMHMEDSSSQARANAGKAPAFAPALMPWVGGSLAGALKLGSEEIIREKWDEAYEQDQEEQMQELNAMAEAATAAATAASSRPTSPTARSPSKQHPPQPPPIQAIGASIAYDGGGMRPPAFAYLPDWTRTPLSAGAPDVGWIRPESQPGLSPSMMAS